MIGIGVGFQWDCLTVLAGRDGFGVVFRRFSPCPGPPDTSVDSSLDFGTLVGVLKIADVDDDLECVADADEAVDADEADHDLVRP